MENFPIQGNDPRQNVDKPAATFQKAYFMTGADGKDFQVLEVHISEEENSPVYFRGVPEAYNGGATFREQLAPDFVGDPIEQEIDQE